jgi:RHS repeat-associated protein
VNVSDGTLTTTQDFTLNVTNFAPNNTPTITSTPNLITNLERTYEYNLIGIDPDNDLLLWSLDRAPLWMVIDATTGALRWQPSATQIGEHTVAVKLTDAYGAYTAQEFTLTVRGTNTPPAIVSNPVTSAAQNQVYTYNVVATNIENDEVTYSLGRRPVGMTISDEGKVEWKPTSSQIGSQTVEAIARDSQGATSTQTFTIEVGTTAINNAPTITSTPKFVASVGSPYQYQVVATDPDTFDTLTYQILSKPSGVDVQINLTTGLLTWASPAAGQYQIVVGAVDAGGLGAAQRFTLTARNNSNPVINSTAPSTVTPGSIYAYDVKAVDADGDNLTYSLDSASLGKGITVDALGRLRFHPTTTNVGNNTINVTVNDGNGGSATQTINLNVTRDTVAPSLRLIALNDTANLGSDITFQARATDNVKVASLQLTVDGTPVVLDANGIVTVKASRSGTIRGVAIATDTSGNTKQETFDVLVIDPTDVEAPTVSFEIEGINDGDFVKSPTSIRATITDDSSLDYYRLLVAPVNGGEFKELWRNDNPTAINNGLLVEKFDPSLLQNDSYIVRLEVADNGGKISDFEQVVDVAGDLKLGNFRLSFTDLTVPVTGIPITLTRTYDTLTSNTTDDFGYGWRMEFRDTDLRTSLRKPDELQQELGVQNAWSDGTRVYITLPGGKREAFTFRPKQVEEIDGTPLLYFSKYFYTPEFVADKGVTSTLTVDSQFITLNRNTNEFMGFAGNGYNPADQYFGGKYILTTKEGIKYEIDALSGDLLTISDTNGNKLTYTDEAVTSSTGKKITFKRDAQGRITSVVDPAGELIKYEYDDSGDLISVTDRENNTTRIEYNLTQKHYLNRIIDPLGRTGARNEYGEDGRLKKVFDANGNPVEMAYNPDSSVQTVKDALGNSTIYEYDERGNTVTEIDALGGITKRTFDEDNNLLNETNPEGETTTYTYDRQGNQLTSTDALGNTTKFTYNKFDNALTVTDALGNTTKFTYDGQGNQTSLSVGGKVIQSNLNSEGQVTSVTGADGSITQFFYDSRGRVIRQIDALGNESRYTYDAVGNQLTETKLVSINGSIRALETRWTYDREGKVTSITDPAGNTTRYELNALGKATAVIDPLGRRTEYRYDASGKLIKTIYADGTSQRTSYDALGREVAKTDQLGRTTLFTYDALGRLIETILPDDTPENLTDNAKLRTDYDKVGRTTAEIDARGNRIEYGYDKAGRKIFTRDALRNETISTVNAAGYEVARTDALNRATRFFLNEAGREVKTVFADGTSISYTYNAVGLQDSVTDSEGRTTYTIWDKLGRPVEIILPDSTPENLPDNPRIRKEYDGLGRLIAEIDVSSLRTEYKYDEVGRLSSVTDGRGTKTFTYDAVGNRISETDALGRTTQFIYNNRNQLIETIYVDSTRSRIIYDAVGNVIAKTDSFGNTTRYEYDAQNQLTAVVDALNQSTKYSYDLAGNLIQIKDANNHVTQHEYDKINRRTATMLQMGQRLTTTYDAVSNITSTTDFNGDTILYKYDALNRMSEKLFPNSNKVEYTYTSTGKLQSIKDQWGTNTYKYDAQDRLIEKVDPDGRYIRYTYDAAGNRTGIITLNGTTTYTYDQYKQLSTVTDSKSGLTTYTYDKVGNLIRTELSNGTLETRSFDNLNRLVYLENKKTSGDIISSYRYTLDAVGNRLAIEENNGRRVNYTYDNLYRLTQEKITDLIAGNRTIDYAFDAVGNRLSGNDSLQGLTTYTYDNNDRLLTETLNGQVTSYTYDNNGNTLTITNPNSQTTYDWDYENRLIEVDIINANDATETKYRYNADGVRVASIANGQETRYLIDANQPYAQVVEEYSPSGNVQATYVYGLDLISQTLTGATSFYHVDGLGSTRALTNASGNVTDTYTYDAYGNLIGSTGDTVNKYLYTGEQYDSNLGEYYLRARYYDPSVGRFTARDPFEGFLEEPLSLAKYPYVHGNPINYIDPSGLLVYELETASILQRILASLSTPIPIGAIGVARTVGETIAIVSIATAAITVGLSLELLRDFSRRNGIPTLVFLGGNLEEHARHVQHTQFGIGNTVNRIRRLEEIQRNRVPVPGLRDASLEKGGFISPFLVAPHPVILPFYAPVRTAIENDRGFLNILPRNGRLGLPPRTVVRDEFPFSTTTSGGTDRFNNNQVSVRYVPDAESRRQAGLISAFYNDINVNLIPDDRLRGRFLVVGIPQLRMQSGYFTRDGIFRGFTSIGTPPA